MTSKDDNKMSKGLYFILALFTTLPLGFMGAFIGFMEDDVSAFTGFAWGIGIAVALVVVSFAGIYIWEWIQKEAYKGKLLPFLLVGFLAAVVISGYLALNMGSPTCIDSETDNRGSTCLEYADDGFEATDEQKWDKFRSTLPVTVIITSLVAYIVRQNMEKDKKK